MDLKQHSVWKLKHLTVKRGEKFHQRRQRKITKNDYNEMFLCLIFSKIRKSATSKNSLQFPQVVSVINKWAHFHPRLQFPITPTCEQLSIPTNQRLIKLIALPPSGLERHLAAVPSPILAISLSLTPPSSISFSISTSHTHTRLQVLLLWNRLSTISLSQYSLLMVSCSQTAAPLIRSVWLALHLSSNAGMAALICPQLKSSWFFRIFWSNWSYIY